MVSDISIWTEELAGIYHQQMNDGQDNHEYEEAVDPNPGPLLSTNRAAAYVPTALPGASSMPALQSTSPVSPKAAYAGILLILTQLLLCCCLFQVLC